jgi:hypothetical protein
MAKHGDARLTDLRTFLTAGTIVGLKRFYERDSIAFRLTEELTWIRRRS